MTREGLDESKRLFEQAIRLDPELRAWPTTVWPTAGTRKASWDSWRRKEAMPQGQGRGAARHRTG